MIKDESQENEKRAVITVMGHVQGVFFREETKDNAEKLGLKGFVRNELNASVPIIAEGEEKNLQKLIKWARIGTKWSKVESVSIEWRKYTGEFLRSEIR